MSTTTSSAPQKLSLISAIFININIMLGSGIFINTVVLSEQTGALGALVYGIGGLLILPLILAFSELLGYYPNGGTFYEFGASVHPLMGFVNSWSYFIGKLATPAIGIHVFVTLMQAIYPVLGSFNPLVLDTLLVLFFIALNMFNLKTGRNINFIFIALKLIPITFVIFTALFMFDAGHFNPQDLPWNNIPAIVPLIIFAFAGFEASCSLSKSIENPEKNGPRAIMISYFITLTILMVYQASFFGILGPLLGKLSGFQDALPCLIQRCIPTAETWQWFFKAITLSGIATSALGSSYGVIFSNIWNLHILADHHYVICSRTFTQKNRYGTPFACVIAAGIIILCYQWISGGNLEPLKQISAIGNLSAYTISIIAFLVMCVRNKKNRLLALLSLTSCVILCSTVVFNAIKFGALPLIFFMGAVVLGVTMFAYKQAR